MKAAQFNTYGGPEVIEIHEVAIPKPQKNQVLVQLHAASINVFDYKLRSGYMKDSIPLQFPVTIGADFAGAVKEVGGEVEKFKVGEEVYGSAIVLGGGSGAFAECAVSNMTTIASRPQTISFEEAAALPLVGSSAVQALEEHINLQAGQKILIHGGAGGIGHIAIQLAHALGAYVATTVSADDMDFVKDIGADEVIDYKRQKFEEILHDCDAVFDTVGGETTERSFTVIKKGGIIVSMLGEPNPALAKEREITAIGQVTHTNNKNLSRLAGYVDQGKIKVNIDKTFTLEQAKEAFEYQEKQHPRGKVVVKM